VLVGCGLSREIVGGPPPIPIGPIGPVVANPHGGPPIECRGIPIQPCTDWAPTDVGRKDITRLIVTCTKVCTPTEGQVRLDYVISDGRLESGGEGAYSGAQAVPAASPEGPLPEGSG
jgi:hypothetical protein